MGLKLNLGCGERKMPRPWENVDRWGTPDRFCNLEKFPWPWADDSVSEVQMIHVLEHLGQAPEVYIKILKELYRVCQNKAKIRIVVPHPRHDHFLNDPTHVRPVTPEGLRLFCQRLNREWREKGFSNSCLGLEHEINFEVTKAEEIADPGTEAMRKSDYKQFLFLSHHGFNAISAFDITLEVTKQ